MLFRNTPSITKLAVDINTKDIPAIKSAKLVFVDGKGSLDIHSFSISDSYYGSCYISQITLNNMPLIQINSPGCPTCNSILATGYGIANAKCKELNDIQKSVNAPFVSLDDSITVLTPLFRLLKSGLYIVADVECYPTDENENFFWNVANELDD
ncbi:hypothetical protein RBG61_09135 [Paludicola sp. MB14-C6]|uniref:hypothetical protein n=1 Tax=Paludihabitans sp. MB14-C6 TaxID=3070656 RepID=UPI0027DC42F5|nr:hypothetical protein [Paludicola sp. MB14-C6]WMJ22163.1 hypothetical protein RBG61_09135 [Paludicola sp. MB14-C6]